MEKKQRHWFYEILDEHQALLKKRGYDEKSLNCPYKEGWFMSQLQRQLSLAVDQCMENDSVEFGIRTVGFFNQEQDIIRYDFHYSFNLDHLSLTLKQVDIFSIIDQKKAVLKLDSNLLLPSAKETLAIVVRKRTPKKHSRSNFGLASPSRRKM